MEELLAFFRYHFDGALGADGGTDAAPLTVVEVYRDKPLFIPCDTEVRAEEKTKVTGVTEEGTQAPGSLTDGCFFKVFPGFSLKGGVCQDPGGSVYFTGWVASQSCFSPDRDFRTALAAEVPLAMASTTVEGPVTPSPAL